MKVYWLDLKDTAVMMYGWRISSYPKLMRRSRIASGTISCLAASSNDPGPKVIGRTGTACVEQRDGIVSSALQHLIPPVQRSCNGLTGWQNTAQIRASCDDCWIRLPRSSGVNSSRHALPALSLTIADSALNCTPWGSYTESALIGHRRCSPLMSVKA